MKRTWEFIDSPVLRIWKYDPIDDNRAKIEGSGKIWNDRVKVGDTIIVKTTSGKGELLVDEITFCNETFEAVVTLGNHVTPIK